MFNRICHTVSQTEERCAPRSRRHRSPMPLRPAGAPCGPSAHNWSATAEAL